MDPAHIAPPAPTAVIQIVFYQNQPIQVTGPLDNKLLCYGMLEMAKDAIRDFKPPEVIPVTGFNINNRHK